MVKVTTFEESDVYTFGGDFVVDNVGGSVSNQVLSNADHPYLNSRIYSTVLKHPVIVTSGKENFSYEDVAIVEPGPAPGQFYDYVVIEASADLQNWVEMDRYDGSKFQEWLDVYNAGGGINDDLFKEQTINLFDFFEEGDVIAVRFRLITDPLVDSFGWAIRSINPNAEEEAAEEEEEETQAIANGTVVYPTVSNGTFNLVSDTTIKNAKVEVYSLSGGLVFTKNIGKLDNSVQTFYLSNLKSGMYFATITGDSFTKTSRIVVK